MHTQLDGCPVLVLNADFRPLSYFPLSLIPWHEAIKAVFLDRVHIVSEYEDISVKSPSTEMGLPSVVALKEYVHHDTKPAFTRFNLFLRDKFTCQYCAGVFDARDLTFDHVIPRSKGGRTSWDNIVASCQSCNTLKGDKMTHECGMHPIHRPMQPSSFQLQERGRGFPPNFLHESWNDYLYWDTELED